MVLLLISKWRFAFDGLKETNDYKLLSAAGSLLKIMVNFHFANFFDCFTILVIM